MINFKPELVTLLKQVNNNVAESWTDEWTRTPIIIYEEEANEPYTLATKGEVLTLLRYRIDIYSKSSTSSLKLAINDKLTERGFTRLQSIDNNDENWRHSIMRFEGVIDLTTKKIFKNK
ncbi:hypothetical protein ABGF48_03275 [Helcococcus bovis]|uniref:hypothetical protein n=1 Tax=Helcococcus bovis TaxID=3153252 RepID=UPI0038B828BC